MKKSLSPAQQRMMNRLRSRGGVELVPGGSRDSGRLASAWFRTARSLEGKGLVRITTWAGGDKLH